MLFNFKIRIRIQDRKNKVKLTWKWKTFNTASQEEDMLKFQELYQKSTDVWPQRTPAVFTVVTSVIRRLKLVIKPHDKHTTHWAGNRWT